MLLALFLLLAVPKGKAIGGFFVTFLLATLVMTPKETLFRSLYQEKYDGILFQEDDYYGSVAFHREWSTEREEYLEVLYVNAFNMAGNNVIARRYTTNLTALALLLHPEPKDVLVVCMGLGNTVRTALEFKETVNVDCVELSQKVLKALKFTSHGPGLLKNDKLRLIVGDGRNHLLGTQKKYDIISAEPPPPLHAGVVNLYSKEYYELCQQRLKPGGIVVQWLPVFQMSDEEAKVIIRAFTDTFEHVGLWEGGGLQLVLLGSDKPMKLDLGKIRARTESNLELLSENDLGDPYKMASYFLAGTEELKDYTKNVPPLTDDWPRIQVSGPRSGPRREFLLFPGIPATSHR